MSVAYGEISLQQMLIRISVGCAASASPPGAFSSRGNNKLLRGRLRAEADGHLSPSYGIHIKTAAERGNAGAETQSRLVSQGAERQDGSTGSF